MLPVFENVFDVLAFLVHHFALGFQTVEERQHALKVVEEANPLTPARKQAELARIEAEREKDTGRPNPVAVAAPAFSLEDLNAAAEKAVAAYIASQQNEKPASSFSVTPSFVPVDKDANQ